VGAARGGSGLKVAAAATAYLQHLMVERGVSPNTVSSYRRDLDRYVSRLEGLGRAELGEVTGSDVADWVASLRSGDADRPALAPASVARACAAVRGLHRFAVLEGWAEDDPTGDLRSAPPPRRLPKALGLDDVTAMIEAAGFDRTPTASRDAALVEVLYGTGARISEAVGLTLDDLATDPDCVRLTGKGGKQRIVPLGRCARDAVQVYLGFGRPALVGPATRAHLFLNSRGAPLSRQSAWAVVRRAAHRAGVDEQIGPHTLRHTFATHLLDGGADVRTVQELLGHASVATTQIYTMVTVDHLREVYATAHPRARREALSRRRSAG
jgi:integrase/recombinase XerD